jgi:hypothetical protein
MPSWVRPACNIRGQHPISASWTRRRAGVSWHSPAPNYAFKRTAGTGHGVSWCQIGPRPLNAPLAAMLRTSLLPLFALIMSCTPAITSWDDPKDPVGITTPAVASGRLPILRVVHMSGRGGWQFYDDRERLTSPVILPKTVLLELDPSLGEIRSLPIGWEAERESPAHPWKRMEVVASGS